MTTALEQAAVAYATGNRSSSFTDDADKKAFLVGAKFERERLMPIIYELKTALENYAHDLSTWDPHLTKQNLAKRTLASVDAKLKEITTGGLGE